MVDHVVRTVVSEDRRLCTPEPVLVRSRALVTQHPPRLRWALKNPATQGPWGDAWGDTHFARCLAAALRELGQDVVTDRGSEFYRSTGYLDDVVLTLRGRTEFQPSYGQVNLAWVISHPEMLSWQEATSYDRVLAASESWSKKMSERWGMHIDPLMQATDPGLFHPDRAAADSGPEVLFVGNSRGKRRPMVEDAMAAGLPLSVYGTCWEEFLPPGVLRGEFVPNTDLGAMYASAGVVLNDHWDDMRADGFLSNRLFDAAASGARVDHRRRHRSEPPVRLLGAGRPRRRRARRAGARAPTATRSSAASTSAAGWPPSCTGSTPSSPAPGCCSTPRSRCGPSRTAGADPPGSRLRHNGRRDPHP